MISLFRKCWFLTAVALLFFASASFAQTTMTLTGTGNNVVVSNSSYGFGVYVDPYTATIDTKGVLQTNVPAVCDDWSDNSYVGNTWTVNTSTLGPSGPSGTVLFGNSPYSNNPSLSAPLSQAQLYQEVAFLTTLLLQNSGSSNPNQQNLQAGISFAIWELTYPYSSNQELPSPSSFLSGPNGDSAVAADVTWAMGQLNNAISTNSLGGAYSFEILTPTQAGAAQEFLVQTPESSTTVMLGADMLGLLALAYFFRRRVLQPLS